MKNSKIGFLVMILLGLCLTFSWSQSCSISAYGYVTDEAGNPIAGATVRADTTGTTTTAEGYYTVSRVQMNCGSLSVRVEAAGYEVATKSTPSSAGSYNLNFTLIPLAGYTPTPSPMPTPVPPCPCKKGDVNCDGTVSIIDALMVAQYAVGLQPPNFNICAADVYNVCTVNPCIIIIDIVDALMIARYSVGVITNF